jgi:hypothetical protein
MYYIIKAQARVFFVEQPEKISLETARNVGSIALFDARRLWLMEGVCSLKHLAKFGTPKPSGCKVPCPIQFTTLYGVQDIIEATEDCKASLDLIPEWTAWPKDAPWRSDEFDDRILAHSKNSMFFAKSATIVDWIDGLPAMRLTDARRLRSWVGACSMSELAQRGVSDPELCIFEAPAEGTIEGIIEIACVTKQAAATLDAAGG